MSAPPHITIIDYARPLAQRAAARKSVGRYCWTPTPAGSGRGFYQSQRGLFCDARGSTFDLRLEPANDHLSDTGYGSLARVSGYFCDADGDGDTLQPIVARLPHGRGFLAGWTMGEGMCGSLAPDVYGDIEDAARAAHAEAESDAQRSREDQERERADEFESQNV